MMQKLTKDEIEKALTQPASVFDSPQQVLDADEVSQDEKRQILSKWKTDAKLVSIAEEEGITSEEGSMLARVTKALSQLDAE